MQIFVVLSHPLCMGLSKDDIRSRCFRSAERMRSEEISEGFFFLLLVSEVKCAHLIGSAHNTTLALEFRFFLCCFFGAGELLDCI